MRILPKKSTPSSSPRSLGMEENREPPPFWSQWQKVPSFPPPPPSSTGIRLWVLILLTSIFVILLIPSPFSFNIRGFPPGMVNNRWDTLTLTLVVFAILCGIFSRDLTSGEGGSGEEWVLSSDALEQNVYEENRPTGIRRMRNSKSYPDLRREFHGDDDWGVASGWRFDDDIQLYRRRLQPDVRELCILDEPIAKAAPVDTTKLWKSPTSTRSQLETLQSSTPTLPPTVEATNPTPFPPPPPPPPPPVFLKQKMKSHRSKGAAAKNIVTAIALFYNKKRRSEAKKIHHHEWLQSANQSPCSDLTLPRPPPPPPPPPFPPPPYSILSHIFTHRKGVNKMKMFKSTPAHQLLPPPLPPTPTFRCRKEKEASLVSNPTLPSSMPTGPPPIPPPPPLPSIHPRVPSNKNVTKPTYQRKYHIAPPSPLRPPPPPPPPSAWKEKEGSIYSNTTLPSSTPIRSPPPPPSPPSSHPLPSKKKIIIRPTLQGTYCVAPASPLPPPLPMLLYGEQSTSSFCPSPDVNHKADIFIKRFRAGLKTEKLNALREKDWQVQDTPQERQQEMEQDTIGTW